MAMFKAQFKTVSAKSDSIHAGKKRDDMEVEYTEVKADEIVNLDPAQVAKILNNEIIAFGKRVIAENGDNWDYKPQASDLTFDAMYADVTAPSARGNRILSKANLLEYGIAFEAYVKQSLGKSDQSARANKAVVEAKFAPIAHEPQALATIGANLAEFEPESDKLKIVHNALVEYLTELMTVETQDLKDLL